MRLCVAFPKPPKVLVVKVMTCAEVSIVTEMVKTRIDPTLPSLGF